MTPSLSRHPRFRRAGAAALIATAAATVLTGCGGVGAKLTFSDVVKSKVSDIVITGAGGDVTIRTEAITETRINRIIHRNSDPGDSYRVEASTLTVDTDCGPNCSVTYDIVAPQGVKVSGSLSSGDVQLTGVGAVDLALTSGRLLVDKVKGDVRARATSGNLEFGDITGKLTASVQSGNVRAVRIGGGPVDVRATSGDVDVDLTVPMSLTAEATSGSVRAHVPAGKYDITTTARSGEVRLEGLGLDDDASSPHKLIISAGSGDVDITTTPAEPDPDVHEVPLEPDAPESPEPALPSPTR
jgi:hypothetical protein